MLHRKPSIGRTLPPCLIAPRLPRPRATCPWLTCVLLWARDAAFCFTYAETLEALQEKGSGAVLFSPLEDTALPPNIGGLYLAGGYPELYAAQLAATPPCAAP